MYDSIIIGGGFAGMAMALLRAKAGERVLLLEAHDKLGGCAGYFDIGDVSYSAGATTLNQVGPNGILSNFFNEFGINSRSRPIDPGLIIHLNDKILKFGPDLRSWEEQISQHFGHECAKWWSKTWKFSQLLWPVVEQLETFPPRSIHELKSISPALIGLIPYSYKTVADTLPPHSNEFVQLIDELLMITSQNTSEKVPYILACLGLNYANDVSYPAGTLKDLVLEFQAALERYYVDVKCRHSVRLVIPGLDRVNVSTDKGEFQGRKVFSSLPVWNNAQIMNDPKIKSEAKKYQSHWSAMSAYGTCLNWEGKLDGPYHQVHTKLKGLASHSIFVSFFEGNNPSFTLSTHIRDDFSLKRKTEDYRNFKQEMKSELTHILNKIFSEMDIKIQLIGTPLTFEKFTGRFQGRVGGIGHSMVSLIGRFPMRKLGAQQLYFIGDTTFPGQGIASVIKGASLLNNEI